MAICTDLCHIYIYAIFILQKWSDIQFYYFHLSGHSCCLVIHAFGLTFLHVMLNVLDVS